MGTGSVFNPPNPPPTVFPSGYLVGSTPSCNDWVVFPTSTKGTSTQFNLIAFKNLYGGGSSPLCTSVPTVKFAYDVATNNGVGNPFLASPTVSLDGTKIGVLEYGGTQGQFHVIRLPTTDSGPNATFPNPNPASVLPACGTAPCQFTVSLVNSNGTNAFVRWSGPFVDYATDTAYIGDDNGAIHKITPVSMGRRWR
jgi:hypothetical protein